MSADDWIGAAPYLVGIAAFYLLPLIISREAKRSTLAALRIVSVTALMAVLIITVLFPLGAGLVGPIELADYLRALAFYVLPSIPVLAAWAGMVILLGSRRN